MSLSTRIRQSVAAWRISSRAPLSLGLTWQHRIARRSAPAVSYRARLSGLGVGLGMTTAYSIPAASSLANSSVRAVVRSGAGAQVAQALDKHVGVLIDVGENRLELRSLDPERGGEGWLHSRPMLAGCRGTQAVHARGGAVEQAGFFVRGVVGDQALERVPQDGVAAADLVHGEIRLEHAAVYTELLDREVVVAPRGLDQLVAGGWPRPLMPAKAVDFHVDAPQLVDDVWACCQFGKRASPPGEDLVGAAGVRANAQWTTEVIQHNGRLGKRACQSRELGQLRVVTPGLEAQLPWRQVLEASTKVIPHEQARSRLTPADRHRRVG